MTTFAPAAIGYFGLIPERVIERGWVWQLVTYMFLHAGALHILFNMLGIWMFGVELERRWGTPFFIKYYAVSGIGGGLTFLLLSLLPFDATAVTYVTPAVGASGALFGLLLAFAIYYPERPILLILVFVPARIFVMIYGGSGPAQHLPAQPRRRRRGPPRRDDLRLPVPAGRPRRPHGRDQIPVSEVEDEPPAPQVRRLRRRAVEGKNPLMLNAEC